jgi:hypothetical protein
VDGRAGDACARQIRGNHVLGYAQKLDDGAEWSVAARGSREGSGQKDEVMR